jgi:hypothetical protein
MVAELLPIMSGNISKKMQVSLLLTVNEYVDVCILSCDAVRVTEVSKE